MTSTKPAVAAAPRSIAARALVGIGAAITGMCLLLLGAAVVNDVELAQHTGYANAEVVGVGFDRTTIRFLTPDGIQQSPPNGVLYPLGLEPGQLVRVEYDTTQPTRVRVAGRTAALTLLPLGTTSLFTWLVVGPPAWVLHRRAHGRPVVPGQP